MECIRTWIQCSGNLCGKWRVVRDEIAAKYADIPWTCDMNEDPCYNKCTVPEEKVDVPRGKKVVVTKFPYEKGDIIMAKMAGYCMWPAFITPDPNCDEYYDAVLNDNDDEEEITHIHVEFFGQPRTHAWIKTQHAFPYTRSKRTMIKSKWRRTYNIAMEDAVKSLPLTCEERLEKCAFRYLGTSDPKEESQILQNAQKECRQQYNHNVPKRKGRPKKSIPMESSKSVTVFNNRNCAGCDSPDQCQSQKLETEKAMSSRRGRKRRAETIESLNHSTSNTSSTINQSPGMTGIEERNDVPLHPILDTLTQEKKSRKRKPRRFISPFLAPHVSDMNEKMQEEKNTELVAEQAVPQLQVSGGHPQASLKSAEAGMLETCSVIVPSMIELQLDPNRSSTNTKPNKEDSNSKPDQHSREEYIMPVTTADRLQMAADIISLVPGASNLTLSFQESSETNVRARAFTSKKVFPPQYPSEEHECDLLSNNSCSSPTYEPQHFTVVGKQSSKRCPEIFGYEYVPSSNPCSPQIVPTEEDLEEDCGISIQRELEEMERILQDEDSVDLKGLSAIKTKMNLTLPFEPKANEDHITLTDDVVKDAINDMLKLEEDISQLDDSTELDFV